MPDPLISFGFPRSKRDKISSTRGRARRKRVEAGFGAVRRSSAGLAQAARAAGAAGPRSGAPHGVAAIEAFVASAVAYGNVAAAITYRGVAHHLFELGVERAVGVAGIRAGRRRQQARRGRLDRHMLR